MKPVVLMFSLLLFPRLLVAQVPDIETLLGENWNGLYLNDEKRATG